MSSPLGRPRRTLAGIASVGAVGTEPVNMLDNVTADGEGHLILLEDIGNNAHNGKVWKYDPATDTLTLLARHDPARFVDVPRRQRDRRGRPAPGHVRAAGTRSSRRSRSACRSTSSSRAWPGRSSS